MGDVDFDIVFEDVFEINHDKHYAADDYENVLPNMTELKSAGEAYKFAREKFLVHKAKGEMLKGELDKMEEKIGVSPQITAEALVPYFSQAKQVVRFAAQGVEERKKFAQAWVDFKTYIIPVATNDTTSIKVDGISAVEYLAKLKIDLGEYWGYKHADLDTLPKTLNEIKVTKLEFVRRMQYAAFPDV
jgi:hypothetical protein